MMREMTIRQALWGCRNIPPAITKVRAMRKHLDAAFRFAEYEGAATEALEAIRQDDARIKRLEGRLKQAKIAVMEAIPRLTLTEGEIVAAFYLSCMSIAQVARERRCSARYVKRAKARAVKKMQAM